MKKVLAILAVLLIFMGVTGCSKKEKQYTDGVITLTLPEGFTESDDEDYDYVLENEEVIILCSHADKQFLTENGVPDISLDDFTAFFSADETLLLNRSFKGYNVFSYEAEVDSTNYYYLVSVYDTNDGYWLVNFVCDAKNESKLERTFLDWAGKVTFK